MEKRNKVAAIIQARMGSTRLPGKVLIKIQGKEILWHIVSRLKLSKKLDLIIIATTNNKKDDQIVQFCEINNLPVFRGSENDVLERYYLTSLKYKVDIVVRITADCPFIDPNVVDKTVNAYMVRKSNYDGASNIVFRTYPRGFDTEVFTSECLKNVWRQAKLKYEREHVTPYIYTHKDKFRIYSVKSKSNFSDMRLTLDEIPDLILIRKIYDYFKHTNRIFLLKDIVNLFRKNPYLKAINQNVEQKIN
jgi:spore coat polysaccharide biosynthesis protein SpsF